MNKLTSLGILVLARKFLLDHVKRMTADTLGWLAAIVLHCSTIPSLLALLTGLSDRTPNLDLVLFVWASLVLLFARAILLRDQLNTVTIGAGFIAQAVMMSLILFK